MTRTFASIFIGDADDFEAADLRPTWYAEAVDSGNAVLQGLAWLDPTAGFPAALLNETVFAAEAVTINGLALPGGSTWRAIRDTAGGIATDWAQVFNAGVIPSDLWIEVPGDQATLSTNEQHHLADALAVAAPAPAVGGWFAVRSRGPGGSTVTGVTSGAVPGDGTVVYYVENAGAWERLPAASGANPTAHLTETAVAPATAGTPTIAEIAAAATATTLTDAVLTYTGTDTATDPVTRVYHVDNAGAVTLLLSPTSAVGDPYQEVLDATARALVVGMVEGDVVKETSTGEVFKWDGAAWRLIGRTIITDPNYQPATNYTAGDVVLSQVPVGSANPVGQIGRYQRNANGVSGGGAPSAMDLAEEANWTFLSVTTDTYAALNDVDMAGIQDGDSVYWDQANTRWVPGKAERFWGSLDTFALVLGLTGATEGDEVFVEETQQILKLRSPDGIVAADPTNGGHWFISGELTFPKTHDATTATYDDTSFSWDVV